MRKFKNIDGSVFQDEYGTLTSNAFEVLNSSGNIASATIGGQKVVTEASLTEFLANYIKFGTTNVESTTLPDACRIYIQVKE